MLKMLAETAASLVFPSECELCQIPLQPFPPSGVCDACRSQIRWIAPPHCRGCGRTVRAEGNACSECFGKTFPFERALASAIYEGAMKDLIHVYKFGSRKYLKNFFTDILSDFLSQNTNPAIFDCVAAIPMDPVKKNERGFNQSELLSAALARSLGRPDHTRHISRIKHSQSQHLLKKKERMANVKDSFRAVGGEFFKQKNVLLVDDILTTGQTASECAKVLKKEGASSVTLLVLARGA